MSEPANSELSFDLQTLERSEATAGKTEEAETSKTGTGEMIQHSLFPTQRLPACIWPWAVTYSRGTVQLRLILEFSILSWLRHINY